MISRRTTILTILSIVPLIAFSGFAWLIEATGAERRPAGHWGPISWAPLYSWTGPTLLQKIAMLSTAIIAIAALWSLWRDQKPRRRLAKPPQTAWSREDDEALRRYLREQQREHGKRAS